MATVRDAADKVPSSFITGGPYLVLVPSPLSSRLIHQIKSP
jgi:hypothetical protein